MNFAGKPSDSMSHTCEQPYKFTARFLERFNLWNPYGSAAQPRALGASREPSSGSSWRSATPATSTRLWGAPFHPTGADGSANAGSTAPGCSPYLWARERVGARVDTNSDSSLISINQPWSRVTAALSNAQRGSNRYGVSWAAPIPSFPSGGVEMHRDADGFCKAARIPSWGLCPPSTPREEPE